jgi:uncharacterized membrane protein YdjX (TVP38/TMEM64 family)
MNARNAIGIILSIALVAVGAIWLGDETGPIRSRALAIPAMIAISIGLVLFIFFMPKESWFEPRKRP